jgi:peptidoglycan/xylan/chitin deacetylase (PgdA/CDA1 family)
MSKLAPVALVLGAAITSCRSGDLARTTRPPEAARAVTQELIAPAEGLTGLDLPDKTLILTFDDGPSPLDVAGELATWLHDRPTPIHATFFLNGACIAATTLTNNSCGTPTPNALDVIAKELAEGHLVGNHTTTHRDMTTIDPAELVQELTETDADIASYMPWNRMLFRAPYGNWDDSVYATLSASAMNKYVGPVYWSIGGGPTDATRAADWECWQNAYTTRQCGDLYLNETHAVGRGIVLMHDRYGDTSNHDLDNGTGNTVDMVKYILPTLEAEGYTFKATWEDPAIAALLPTCDASCASCSGPSPAECTSCADGSWLGGGVCHACTTCPAGTFASAACTATADTVCSPVVVPDASAPDTDASAPDADASALDTDASAPDTDASAPDTDASAPDDRPPSSATGAGIVAASGGGDAGDGSSSAAQAASGCRASPSPARGPRPTVLLLAIGSLTLLRRITRRRRVCRPS